MGRFSVPNPEPPRNPSERHKRMGTKRESVCRKDRRVGDKETITKWVKLYLLGECFK